ncbi:hypothetical protein [Natrinema versiforme]|uniref:Uncharacterized protein n=1 Tax=Natrinema versiforme TaxID=88724 RepID=A0A4P8WLG3_9EURY|nr:hypothetical protein [Natrinema versiforme]QCS43013.1 hypothetical protein FEJ81_11830 [Natrinema versiforme]
MIEAKDIIEGRKRDGKAKEGRSDDVEEILSDREIVGFQTELPLLERGYSDYPDEGELLRPSNNDIEKLANHGSIHDKEEIAAELNVDVGVVDKAAELHGIDLPTGGSFDVSVSRLDQLLGDELPEDMIDPQNPLFLSILYLEHGLSISEMADILAENFSTANIRSSEVRQTLVDTRVLKGKTSAEQEERHKQNRGEVNRTTNGGINISTSQF